MHRATTLAAACVTAAAILVLPAISPAGERAKWFDGYEIEYLRAYETAHEADLDVGRNIVDDDLASGEAPGRKRVEVSTARMRAWLNPPEPETVEPVVSATYEAPAAAPASGGCPSYMAGEASSPTATNSLSGAYGCFQVIPSTAEAFDCDLSTMAGQYSCMEAICAGQGNDAWEAANPC